MWLQTLAAESQITLADGTFWLSIGQGLLFGAVCLLFGVWVARFVGLLSAGAPAGETLAVGLASGLLVLTSWWAAVASAGRSSFTPVAIGFAVAIGLAVARRWQQRHGRTPTTEDGVELTFVSPPDRSRRRPDMAVAVTCGALVIVALALVYGSTLTQSPRDGVQPVEFMDEAYYAILGRDLATTGTESNYSPSGFDEIAGFPAQNWYHWGEAWLTAAAITIFGSAALDARHLIVLPLILVAAAALTGTVVRRVTRTTSRGAFLFGFCACLFLAPLPFARGLIYGVTTYGLVAIAVLFAMYGLTVLAGRSANWTLPIFCGSAAALILPAHVVIAGLAVIGVGSVWAVRGAQALVRTRGLPRVQLIWRRTIAATGILLVATLGWGVLTGHGMVAGGFSPNVSPFNAFWRDAMILTLLGSGALLMIGIAWIVARGEESVESDLYLGTAVLLVVGALIWGARLPDFNTFHLFFGGIALFGIPVAAVAVWSIWLRLRARGYQRFAFVLLGLCVIQIGIGIPMGIERLQLFGPGTYPPMSLDILAEIRKLPLDAKLAYACQTGEESAFWDARLLSIDAHTGRRIVPMCFEAETLGALTGGTFDPDIANPFFKSAPQSALYPDSAAEPSPNSVATFLKERGIHYIYADSRHPNSLAPDALPVASNGDEQILGIP